MNLYTIGSVNQYTKSMEMQIKWQMKKEKGDLTGHEQSWDEWLEEEASDAGGVQTDEKLTKIRQKVFFGRKLTQEEKNYLKAADPQTYEKIKSAEDEQKAYEQDLRRCRTKEEVQRLKLTKLGASLSTIKSVENNPHIGDAQKLAICMQEKYRCDKIEQSTRDFVRSGEYGRLPSEAEKTKAEKELREQEEAKRNLKKEEAAQQTEEKAARPEGEAEKAARPKTEAEKAARPKAEAEKAVRPGEEKAREAAKTLAKPESPEMKKVRHAKARRAYAASNPLPQEQTAQTVDIQG